MQQLIKPKAVAPQGVVKVLTEQELRAVTGGAASGPSNYTANITNKR